MDAVDGPLDSFPCPRCGRDANERFWGPCTDCRRSLVAAHDAPQGSGQGLPEPAAGRFEPAMHVVPNHVATKD